MNEDNGNVSCIKPNSSSNEDLSEYTDADESISAPTEILAEFLSAVMLKDYETALKYCKIILQYEPNNSTAKEFYPLILEKLSQMNDDDSSDDYDENSSASVTSTSTSSDSSEELEQEEAEPEDKASKNSSDGDGTTGSYSSLEDDEAVNDHLTTLAAKCQLDNINLANGNNIYSQTASNVISALKSVVCLGNKNEVVAIGSSDSESPTEPVSQQTVAVLRAKVVPSIH